jgi:hypothetical protein
VKIGSEYICSFGVGARSSHSLARPTRSLFRTAVPKRVSGRYRYIKASSYGKHASSYREEARTSEYVCTSTGKKSSRRATKVKISTTNTAPTKTKRPKEGKKTEKRKPKNRQRKILHLIPPTNRQRTRGTSEEREQGVGRGANRVK